ncbi:M50 family metallopeptidase [Candidatus Chloroploca sp. Khr17]|uniref:M50 family metallopeptidase n=1 Tax=Candidatus Chloroploca sp. Khr17 TaxID=2496869 RepID=UPI00101CE8B5|nr:M50 family metallopeptidase [Candidatus Chloroploca sp. Khr17]
MALDAIITTWSQPEVLTLAGLSLLLAVLWRVPILGWLFYPLRLLDTFVHEMSHGLAAIMTGGCFERFVVYPNREGLAHIRGGTRFVVVSAGYLGPALLGGALILLSATDLAEPTILMGLGIGLALLCLGFVRNLFGFVAGLLLAASLIAAGWYLPPQPASWLFLLLMMHLPLTSANSLIDLIRLSARRSPREQRTDAEVLAEMTHLPALVWALLWFLLALIIVVVTVTVAWSAGA